MKMKLYAYQNEFGGIYSWTAAGMSEQEIDTYLQSKGQLRLSQIIEVDFPELPQDVVIDSQIQAIDNIITQKEGEHFSAIQALKQKRQELLAITHQGGGND